MQVPEQIEASQDLFKAWHEDYIYKYDSYDRDHVIEEQSLIWDKEATKEAKEWAIKEHNDSFAEGSFPIRLKEMKIPFGKFFVFDAKEFLHAGGPGKSYITL